MMVAKRRQHGAALITVLVIVVIVMVIISNLTVTNYRMIKRLENRQLIEQAASIAYSAVDFGRAGLATSGATASVDTLQDIWAQPFPRTKVLDSVFMSGYITDEQSKFNINDLVSKGVVNKNVLNQFTLLLGYLNLPQSLAYNIAFYIASPVNQSDIMMQYTTGKPAYRPGGRPFVDLSELILV
jgi:general secretion pathway protein K